MTKERLRNYRALLAEKETLEAQIETVEAALYNPKIPKYKPATGGQPAEGKAMEDLAAKHMELLDLYQDKMTGLAVELQAIEQAIDSLPPRERTLLRLYYVRGLAWKDVCELMHYSWGQTHNIHAKALEMLKEPGV